MEDNVGNVGVNDIYGDLPGVAAEAAVNNAENESRLECEEEARKRISELETQVAKLDNEARVWAKQRSVLIHNMSTLLKTAKLEVSRKDAEIARLREALDGRDVEGVKRHRVCER